MEKASSAVWCLTSSLNTMSIDVSVRARSLPASGAQLDLVGGRDPIDCRRVVEDDRHEGQTRDRSQRSDEPTAAEPAQSVMNFHRAGRYHSPYTRELVKHRSLGCLFEALETLLLTLIVFLVIQLFVAQPYQIQQQSMENTLLPNQYVLVDKLTPHFERLPSGRHRRLHPAARLGQRQLGDALHQARHRRRRRHGRHPRRRSLRERHQARRALRLRGPADRTDRSRSPHLEGRGRGSCSSWAITAPIRRTHAPSARSRSRR